MDSVIINIPEGVGAIIDTLEKNGFEAYAVGGCVRDSLLGTMPHDWDICTDALPDKVAEIFSHTVPTGIKHGTVTVISDEKMYEVTTYRVDGEYTDNRRPDSVEFTKNIHEDLKRRDFTINAMAYSPRGGLVDICGGREDLKNRVIRCVGEADKRFDEDALRVLRAWRFSCRLGFDVEEKTLEAAKRYADKLKSISEERVRDELLKAVDNTKGFAEAEIKGYRFLRYIIPEWNAMDMPQNNPHHIHTVLEHSLLALASLDENCDIRVKLAVLLHDIGKPLCYTEDENGIGHFYGHAKESARITESLLTRLRFDTRTRESVTELVLYHDAFVDDTPKSVKRWLNRIGEEQLRRLIQIKKADASSQNPVYTPERIEKAARILSVLDKVLEENECFSLKHLAVNGKDLIEAGYTSGPALGTALRVLLDAVISGEVENSRTALIEKAKMIKDICTASD